MQVKKHLFDEQPKRREDTHVLSNYAVIKDILLKLLTTSQTNSLLQFFLLCIYELRLQQFSGNVDRYVTYLFWWSLLTISRVHSKCVVVISTVAF